MEEEKETEEEEDTREDQRIDATTTEKRSTHTTKTVGIGDTTRISG
jgi:hypothetical protein